MEKVKKCLECNGRGNLECEGECSDCGEHCESFRDCEECGGLGEIVR